MSYIPSRAMHRARPTEARSPAQAPVPAASGFLRRLSERLSPSTWTAVAIAAGAVATGLTAAAFVSAE